MKTILIAMGAGALALLAFGVFQTQQATRESVRLEQAKQCRQMDDELGNDLVDHGADANGPTDLYIAERDRLTAEMRNIGCPDADQWGNHDSDAVLKMERRHNLPVVR